MLGRGVCVVFGGASGVGRKYVKEWAKSGRQVAYIDINKTSGRSLMEELGEECAKNVFFFTVISIMKKTKNYLSAW